MLKRSFLACLLALLLIAGSLPFSHSTLAHAAGIRLFVAHPARIAFQVPDDLKPALTPYDLGAMLYSTPDNKTYFQAFPGGLRSLDQTCTRLRDLLVRGGAKNPVINSITVQEQSACLVQAEVPLPDEPSYLVVKQPKAYDLNGTSIELAVVFANQGLIGSIARSLRFEITPQEYLDSVIDLMQSFALMRAKVDWTALRAEAQRRAANAKTVADIYPVLQYVQGQLQDNGHGFFLPARQVAAFVGGQDEDFGLYLVEPKLKNARLVVALVFNGSPAAKAGIKAGDEVVGLELSPDKKTLALALRRAGQAQPIVVRITQASYDTGLPARGALLGNCVGYIELFGSVGNNEAAAQYADRVHQLIRELAPQATCGWVIDLRRNTGGDTLKMIAAVGPLFNEGDIVNVSFPDGQVSHRGYKGGASQQDGETVTQVRNPYVNPALVNQRVAVLTSEFTGSAAEFLTVGFLGRANSRTFGETTAGVPTGNAGTNLFDGSFLNLTVGAATTPAGKAYTDKIDPQRPVGIDWKLIESELEPALQVAINWVRGRSSLDAGTPVSR